MYLGSYQIIVMGLSALPMILRQLQWELEHEEPDQWFWALREIAGVDPVDPSIRGNFVKMAYT